MIINGKERNFLLTVGASAEIADMCPLGDLSRLGELFTQDYGKQVRTTARLIEAMSRGYENQKHYEDPNHEPDALSFDEIMTLDTQTFQDVAHEVMQKFGTDQKPTVEVEESKKKGSAT